MENPEEILHSLEEFSKLKPKDIPRELEDYLCFVAKTGDPVYQWGTIKSLFREKLLSVITEFYESCPSVEIPPCPNVEVFNYDSMKTFILEKLDTFAAAPFTVQRICELLTTPRKEYNRIDKYMRALEKNILVVSTTEPGYRRAAENGDGIVNGLESEHVPDTNNSNDINVEEMDDAPVWSRITPESVAYPNTETNINVDLHPAQPSDAAVPTFSSNARTTESSLSGSNIDSVITCRPSEEQPYVSIEPVAADSCLREESVQESDVTVTITAIPAAVQKRRDSIEPVVSTDGESITEGTSEFTNADVKDSVEASSSMSNNVEIVLQETLSNEAEVANVENVCEALIASPATREDQVELCETTNTEATESVQNESPLIQIPIISQITSGVSGHIEDVKEATNVCADPEEQPVLEEDPASRESIEATPETVPEISTSVTSTTEAVESKTVIRENSAALGKEVVSVSSTEEISNDASDVVLNNNEHFIKSTHALENFKRLSQEVLLANCDDETNLDPESEETEEKQPDERVLKDIQEFASSSSTHHPMELDISEESCQEAPISDG